MTDEEAMALALEEARQTLREGEVPVGAVITRGGEVIARAHNLCETLGDPTAHAEILCMREAARRLGGWRLRGCTLTVTLEPCPMCAGALGMSRMSRCVYGAADPDRGCCGSVYDLPADPDLGFGVRWRAGVLAGACRAPLDSFFAALRAPENPSPEIDKPAVNPL